MILEKTASKSLNYKQGWENVYAEYKQKVSRYDFNHYSELSAMKFVFDHLPEGAFIHMANSSVVRYASWLGAHDVHKALFANRGTSGIDGCTSTSVGFARETEDPVFLITGDVAFFYDINALFCSGEVPTNLRIVLLNNGGGGIFDLLDGPGKFEHSLPYQTTPHSRKARHTCEDAGIAYQWVDTLDALKAEWNSFIQAIGPALMEICTDSKDNAKWFKGLKAILEKRS
jgi:2-succinyl-5-enolpyruvyl-6-hydroxy-3-cyclohexene-1-carboxylate synthase